MTTNYSDHSLVSKSAVAEAAPELPQGSKVDRYAVLEVLGEGGMGVVYKAYDPQLNRGVALKLIRVPQDSQDKESERSARLLREAQALGQPNHPNVVGVHDVGTIENNVFVAMELVEGRTLKAWRKESKPTTREVLEVMRAAGWGLAAAHKAGLVHREVKRRTKAMDALGEGNLEVLVAFTALKLEAGWKKASHRLTGVVSSQGCRPASDRGPERHGKGYG